MFAWINAADPCDFTQGRIWSYQNIWLDGQLGRNNKLIFQSYLIWKTSIKGIHPIQTLLNDLLNIKIPWTRKAILTVTFPEWIKGVVSLWQKYWQNSARIVVPLQTQPFLMNNMKENLLVFKKLCTDYRKVNFVSKYWGLYTHRLTHRD